MLNFRFVENQTCQTIGQKQKKSSEKEEHSLQNKIEPTFQQHPNSALFGGRGGGGGAVHI